MINPFAHFRILSPQLTHNTQTQRNNHLCPNKRVHTNRWYHRPTQTQKYAMRGSGMRLFRRIGGEGGNVLGQQRPKTSSTTVKKFTLKIWLNTWILLPIHHIVGVYHSLVLSEFWILHFPSVTAMVRIILIWRGLWRKWENIIKYSLESSSERQNLEPDAYSYR